MSGDKTEKPTPKKKREAREKGQIAKSQDLTGWLGLLTAVYVLPMTLRNISGFFRLAFDGIVDLPPQVDSEVAVTALGTTLAQALSAITPTLAVAAITATVVTLGQTGVMFSFKPLKPDFKRISPKQGIKRLFSKRSVWETVKQISKLTIVIVVVWPRLNELMNDLVGSGRMPLMTSLEVAGVGVLGIVQTIAWTMVLLAVADYGYQRYQHAKDLKMTKQEVRDEHRNQEGDAQVKGRVRSLQREMARNRMLAEVGDADVVITNPTHVAVALKYDPTKSLAPTVVATGANSLAAKIRERADEGEVPMVQAKPLARALWRACDPGDPIPVTLYEAVAQVLAFVRRLDRRYSKPSGYQYQLPSTTKLDETALDLVPRKKRRS